MLDLIDQEIIKIQDPDMREAVRTMVHGAPIDSWRLASARDWHLKDERGEWGNLYHTVRVVRICENLADILNLDIRECDILRSAAILHDICKHGVNAEAAWIYKDHNLRVSSLASVLFVKLDPEIMTCIEMHMGRWGSVPYDWTKHTITLAFLLHTADCLEARLPHMAIKKPTN